jgi:hypothetical protein
MTRREREWRTGWSFLLKDKEIFDTTNDIKRGCLMIKLLLLLTVAVMLSGCVVYPGYYGHYTSDNYGFPYGYAGPNINFHYTGVYGGRGHHGGYGHHHGGYRGWHR